MQGLAESIVIIEGVGFLNDVLFSGILFALLPTMYLVPRLYGKIEPLLGMKPRERNMQYASGGKSWLSPKLLGGAILLALIAMGAELLSESGWSIGEFELPGAESHEGLLIWISMLAAAVVAAAVIAVILRKASRRRQEAGQLDG